MRLTRCLLPNLPQLGGGLLSSLKVLSLAFFNAALKEGSCLFPT